LALLGGVAVEECADGCADGICGSDGGLAQEVLELGEDLLDGVQIERIVPQEQEL